MTEPGPDSEPTAAAFIARLRELSSPIEAAKYDRYFKLGAGEYGEGDEFIGVRMGAVFALAAEFEQMSLPEIEALLDSPIHEARAGAVKIMARQAGSRKASGGRREELYELFLRRHDRINNWDLVDLGAWDVVGRYLVDRPRDVLDRLAASSNLWERRTAVLATLAFVRAGDVDDTFRIAEVLVDDPHDLIQKAVGGALRAAGDRDHARLMAFLDVHAGTMPRTALRYAIEHLDSDLRSRYLGLRPKRPGRT